MYRPQKCEFCAREIPLTNLKVSNILFCLFIIYNITSNQFWLFQSTKVSNWQTGRATVWVNRAQNSGLVNFVPKLPLPFVQISSIYRKKKKRNDGPRRPETGIKYGFEETEHEFPIGMLLPEKQDYLFRCSVVPRNFSLERPKKQCSIFFPTGFSGNSLYMVTNHHFHIEHNGELKNHDEVNDDDVF